MTTQSDGSVENPQSKARISITSQELLDSAGRRGPVVAAAISCERISEGNYVDAVFENCSFSAAFSSCDLSGARFVNCEFTVCRFANCNFEEAGFSSCRFFDTNTKSGCEFAFSNMEKADFVSCNLASSKLNSCTLFMATFSECNMRGLELQRTSFSKVYSKKHIVNKVRFVSCSMGYSELSELDFSDCELIDCALNEANLDRTNFTGANMSRSVISQCETHQTNLRNVNLQHGRLEGVTLAELADFRGLQISDSQQESLLAGLGIRVVYE